MASIRAKRTTGNLYFDFQYKKLRCREFTTLKDSPTNRKMLEKVLKKIEEEIALGTFAYERYFPNGVMLDKLKKLDAPALLAKQTMTPLFKDFAETWFDDMRPTWRVRTAQGYRAYLDNRLIPHFGEKEVGDITKADILHYRSETAKLSNGKLKAKTINKFVKCLGMIMNEAADRFNFTSPYMHVKPLKEEKVHIEPFSLEEVNRILSKVREDWRDYLLVRFFTGLRSGEIDGLRWKHIDFNRREISVRETYSNGIFEYTKNDGSQREVDMSTLVYQALIKRKELLRPKSEDFVFALRSGNPVHHANFLRRVWTPLLSHCQIKYRKPYQTRHTAATLWLAAGENPTWIAKQMGHSSTQMLFTVYARYVPNLTRSDGSAMDRLLTSSIQVSTQLIHEKSPPNETNASELLKPSEPEVDEMAYWDALLSSSTTSVKRPSIGGAK